MCGVMQYTKFVRIGFQFGYTCTRYAYTRKGTVPRNKNTLKPKSNIDNAVACVTGVLRVRVILVVHVRTPFQGKS